MRIDTDTSALLDGLHLMVRAGHSSGSARAVNEALRRYHDGAPASEALRHGRAQLGAAHNRLMDDITHDDGMVWLAEQFAAQDRDELPCHDPRCAHPASAHAGRDGQCLSDSTSGHQCPCQINAGEGQG